DVTFPAPGTPFDTASVPPPIVFVSQSADRNPEANAACVSPARFVAVPSIATRLAWVAAGEGLAGVSLSGPVGWDYAAGHALLRAVGGTLMDEQGRTVTYSVNGDSSVGNCFGGAPAVVRELARRDWQSVLASRSEPQAPFALLWPRAGRAVAEAEVLARAQGCLLGQLAGDALGGQIEFEYQSLEKLRAAYPDGLRELRDGGHWGNLAGQPTDDSEMALVLARTLVHHGRYDQGLAL